jgi:glycerol-3-phosphate acyltransferase PlsY
MIEILVKVFAAYLFGGLMGGDVMRWLRGGTDLRAAGSGNVGAANALRTRGPGFALGVLAIDAGKGVASALAVPALPWHWPQASTLPASSLGYVCGLAAALGHCYPVFQKFRGGKGVATLAGVFGALLPAALPWMVLVFALVVMLTGYVSLASLLGALAGWAWVVLQDGGVFAPASGFALAILALLLFKHRANLRRLLRGSESRFEKAMVLRRWLVR